MSIIGDNSKKFIGVESLSQEDKIKLKKVIQELNDCMLRINSEQEFMKESINDVAEKMNLDKKIVKKMAKTYYNSSFNKESEEHKTFEDFYTVVLQTGTNNA